MNHDLRQLPALRRAGRIGGMYAVCSAHPLVLEAALDKALRDKTPALIEATSNQVNQFGGYTGMTPADFKRCVFDIADRIGFPRDRVLLGGDHLGPNTWQHLSADEAMQHAQTLVADYARAGFCKIHLDASIRCADDPASLTDETIAGRAARLCLAAEQAWPVGGSAPVYIIGTEVPTPGGAREALERIRVTSRHDADTSLEWHRQAFAGLKLEDAWQRVIGLVVQPGVEFDHLSVVDYQASLASSLSGLLDTHAGIVFEAHSTDYQTPSALRDLVRNGFAILKVGPGLSFALREAVYGLAAIECLLVPAASRSNMLETLERNMLARPQHWQSYCHGDAAMQRLLRHYSYSDRIRYYWPEPEVETAFRILLSNLERVAIPEPLLSQYFPDQYQKLRQRTLDGSARSLLIDRIQQAIEPYARACCAQTPDGSQHHD
ncbi:MAG: D-tagatose-bisphosphate aldolase, class II, non-catalytic subunit [Herbaspirillum sp.]